MMCFEVRTLNPSTSSHQNGQVLDSGIEQEFPRVKSTTQGSLCNLAHDNQARRVRMEGVDSEWFHLKLSKAQAQVAR